MRRANPADTKAFNEDRQGLLLSDYLMKELGVARGSRLSFHTAHGMLEGNVSGEAKGSLGTGVAMLLMHYDHYNESLPPEKRNKH